jgi:hypothetical protein
MEKNRDQGGDAESEAEVPFREPVEAIFGTGASLADVSPELDQKEAGDEGGSLVEDRPNFVEVPEECKQPKQWFRDVPSPEIVKEIRDYVAERGESHTWRGHTHTRPSQEAHVVYRGRFELPEKFQRAKQFLVCPICRPHSRNFGRREGYIAWFPDEWVVRLIGPDCFAEINKEGHEEAVQELKNREKREREIDFLVSRRDQHRLAREVLAAAQRVARALDAFGADLRRKLYVTLNVTLWQDVRTGELEVTREVDDIRRPGKSLFLSDHFGSLDGFKLLDPKMRKLEPKFGPHIAFLEEILEVEDDAWSEKIGQLSNPEVGQLAKTLSAALDAARHLRAEMVELRGFLSPANLGTLRRWGSPNTKGRPKDVYARRAGSVLRVGSSETRSVAVQIPPDIELEIASVAALTAKRP